MVLRRFVLLETHTWICFVEHTMFCHFLCHLHPQGDARTWSDSYHYTSFVLRSRFQSSSLHKSKVSAIRDMIFSSFTLQSATSLTELSLGDSYFKSMGWTCQILVLVIPKAKAEVYSASAGFYADLTHAH